jgi:hypothetical protein
MLNDLGQGQYLEQWGIGLDAGIDDTPWAKGEWKRQSSQALLYRIASPLPIFTISPLSLQVSPL